MRTTLRALPRATLMAMLLVAIVDSESKAAPLPALHDDGWHTWRVEAVVGGSVRCCGTWSQGRLVTKGCNLDTGQSSVPGCDSPAQSADEVQIYVRTEAGEVTRIHAYSPQCPVEAESEIRDLGSIDNAESVSWLDAHVTPHSFLSDDAIAAIAAHAGDEALASLRATVRSDPFAGNRKQALFWMATTGRSQSEAEIARAIAGDADADVREHAVFALSLLPDGRSTAGLIAVLENRRYGMPVREHALFWLAQSDSDEAFEYVAALLGI